MKGLHTIGAVLEGPSSPSTHGVACRNSHMLQGTAETDEVRAEEGIGCTQDLLGRRAVVWGLPDHAGKETTPKLGQYALHVHWPMRLVLSECVDHLLARHGLEARRNRHAQAEDVHLGRMWHHISHFRGPV